MAATDPSPARASDRFTLTPAELDLNLQPEDLGFNSTAELEPLEGVVGQDRALRALEFGLSMRQHGYNIFVAGVTGTSRKELVRRLLEERARRERSADDWVYVHNFDEPDSPLALRLPSGHGVQLRKDLLEMVDRLMHHLPAALKAQDFDTERERLTRAYGRRNEALFAELLDHARQLNMGIRRMPTGIAIFPLRDGQPLDPAEIDKLSPAEQADIQRRHNEIENHLAELVARQQELQRELQQEIEGIVRSLAQRILEPLIARVKAAHPGEQIAAWLDRVQADILEHLDELQPSPPPEPANFPAALQAALERPDPLLRYRVNVVADNAHTQGAPIIVETTPTYKNLFGTIEHEVNLFGRASTNFTRIKPGSLLRANGGYLIFDLDDALTEPLVWKQLKRTLKSAQLHTDVYEPLALISTVGLKPQPIPLDTKLVVLGTPELYYLLQRLDEEFPELFKIRADFDIDTERNEHTHQLYARFVATQVRDRSLLPFTAAAVVEIIRFGARQAGHQGKLSVEFGAVTDLVCEASYWASVAGAAQVGPEHVQQALEQRIYRSEQLAARIRELISEGTFRISISGTRVGQVNGLSVLDLGDYRFGRPSRVTASVGVGQGGIINIERESDLSGNTYDKGMLILEGYLRNRYARHHPLALTASLAFEQSYGWVDGDSASSAEIYCLLSALSGIPLRQDIAVTGSVNQHGEIQAVGGVNEKVEGFYDVCRLVGLTGTQGVCIPRSNVRHLLLRPDVLQAIREGRFHVWAVETIDEGIELLTGLPAGDIDQEGTFHHRLDQRLCDMLAALQKQPGESGGMRVKLGGAAAPPPTLPRLPGEDD